MISCKSQREIELMKEAGRIVALVFEALEKKCVPGISTQELDEIAEKVIIKEGGTSASKGYYGYPGAICISVNETLVHGIPSSHIILHEGDIVSCDVVVKKNGYHADATRTFGVGILSEKAERIKRVTEQSFWNAVKLIKPGIRVGDISHAIQEFNESNGYSVVREYTGHGIGREMHEDPSVPNYGKAGVGPVLMEGMALAIEPMVLEGKKDIRVLGDGWTAKARDGKLTCHYENTVIVTKDGYEIITLTNKEKEVEHV